LELSIKGKQLDTCNALTQHIKTRLTDSVEKYFNHALEPNAVLTKEGNGKQFRTDIIVHIARNIKMHGRATTEEPCAFFWTALERAAKQLRRYKRQLNDHRKKTPGLAAFEAQKYVIENNPDEGEVTSADGAPVIVAEMPTTILDLTVSETVMHMDVNNSSALVFKNNAHSGLNVVYRRADGNIG